MRFCSADCLTAYQRRLDQETIAKIRWLDFVGTTNKAEVRGQAADERLPLPRIPSALGNDEDSARSERGSVRSTMVSREELGAGNAGA
jgi:hypothetical protein